MSSRFSRSEALKFGWQTTCNNLGFLILIFGVAWAVQIVPGLLANHFEKSQSLLSFIFTIVSIFLGYLVGMGLITIGLKYCDSQSPQIEDLFVNSRLFFRFFGATIVYGLVIMIGLLLLIIPGIILMIRLSFYSYLIVDKNVPAIESLKQSFALTKGEGWSLFVWGCLVVLVNLLGVLCLLIGLLWTIPTTMLAATFVYRKFVGAAETLTVLKPAV